MIDHFYPFFESYPELGWLMVFAFFWSMGWLSRIGWVNWKRKKGNE